MNSTHIVPRGKGDDEAIENLRRASLAEIKANADELLTWTQDVNWPIAPAVIEVLLQHAEHLTDNFVKVLQSDDGLWEYFFILNVIAELPELPPSILQELRRIANTPTAEEVREEASIEARLLLEARGLR